MVVLPPACNWKVPVFTTVPLLSVMLYVYGVDMSPPLFVMTNSAVPVLTPVHAPVADKSGPVGTFPGGVLVGVLVGVFVGRNKHEPTVLNVTEDRNDVLYVTVMVAYPTPFKERVSPGCRLIVPP